MMPRSAQEDRATGAHEWLYALLWLLPAVAALLVVNILGRSAPTWALVLAWLLISLVMLAGLWVRALSRRHAFLGAYLHQASPWRLRLRGGPLLALRLWLGAAVLALVLLVAVVRLQQDLLWWLLAASLPLLIGLQALMRRLLRPHVSPVYLPELSWRVTLALQFVTLFGAMAWLALYATYPEFADVTLTQALWHEMSRERAASGPLEALLQLAAAKDALALWLGQQLLPALGSPLLRMAGWILLLADRTYKRPYCEAVRQRFGARAAPAVAETAASERAGQEAPVQARGPGGGGAAAVVRSTDPAWVARGSDARDRRSRCRGRGARESAQ